MPAFKRVYKKLHQQQRKPVNVAIKKIISNPNVGEEKKGNLTGIFIYKFKINRQLYLLAYEWDVEKRTLLALGVHENFYRDLKRK